MSTAAAAPAAPRAGTNRLALVFAGLMMVLLLAALDSTIVATALPTIVGDLGGLDELSWVTSALPARADRRHAALRQARRPARAQAGAAERDRAVPRWARRCAGWPESMTELIAFRAVQGLGAGGLIVLVQASVGDVVPPRERGRYQGLFGAVFGFASGRRPAARRADRRSPLLALDLLREPARSALLALVVISATLPAARRAARARRSTTWGPACSRPALSAIVLVASLGGTTWAWGSAQVVLVALAGAGLLAVLRLRRAPGAASRCCRCRCSRTRCSASRACSR